MYHPLAFAIFGAQIAAAISVLNGFLTTLGQGKIAASAVEGIARQPEAREAITTTMFIGCGLAETSGIYGLIIAVVLLFANPLISDNIDNLMRVVGY